MVEKRWFKESKALSPHITNCVRSCDDELCSELSWQPPSYCGLPCPHIHVWTYSWLFPEQQLLVKEITSYGLLMI